MIAPNKLMLNRCALFVVGKVFNKRYKLKTNRCAHFAKGKVFN